MLKALKRVLVIRTQCSNRSTRTRRVKNDRISEQRSIFCADLWSNMASGPIPQQPKCARFSLQLLRGQNMHKCIFFSREYAVSIVCSNICAFFTRFDIDWRHCTVTKWPKVVVARRGFALSVSLALPLNDKKSWKYDNGGWKAV